MAECINEYQLEVGKNLPINEWRHWKNLFIKGVLLPVVLPCPLPPIEPPSEKELRIAKVLFQSCFSKYINIFYLLLAL